MDVTTQRRYLRAIAVGLFVITAGTIGWSFSSVPTPPAELVKGRAPQAEQARPGELVQPIDDRMVARSLRKPLYDPPAPPPRPSTPARSEPVSPPLELTLVGTIIEPDQSLAILADASGKFDVKGVGQSLELSPQGITLQDIESEQVTLQYRGRESTVQLNRSRPQRADGENRRNNRRKRQ